MNAQRTARAFTLVELLVILAIIGVIVALLLPAIMRLRDSANRSTCTNNLRQIGLGLQNYHGSFNTLPPGVRNNNSADPYPFMSWNTRVLPFLEHDNLWKQAQMAFAQEPIFLFDPPHSGLHTVLPVFACPADPRTLSSRDLGPREVAFTAFLGVAGTDHFQKDGVLFLDSRVRFADISDGTSNTLLVGERPPSADGILGWWYAGEGQSKDGSGDMLLGVREKNGLGYAVGCPQGPYAFVPGNVNNQCDALHFWSLHFGGGANFLFADGSVHFLPYAAAPILPALATRAGGEAVSPPD
jgi:prepilin-type processing-associated H-X9-DG protein